MFYYSCYNIQFICQVEPGFKFLEQIVTFSLQQAMNDDALESSHPVSVVVQNPSEIEEIFDVISYQKGASIIRMLANFIGEDNFKKALFYYMDKRYVKMMRKSYCIFFLFSLNNS